MNDIFPNINSIAGKIEPTFLEQNWWWIALILFACALFAGIIVSRLNSRPAPTAFEIASLRLKSCKNEADDKLYASRLSSAVRDYISAMFDIPAPERTTEEFLQIAASSDKLEESDRAKIAEILILADKAKFAGAQFGADEREKMFSLAETFINEDNEKRKSEKK